jgi:hypothetical protein
VTVMRKLDRLLLRERAQRAQSYTAGHSNQAPHLNIGQ